MLSESKNPFRINLPKRLKMQKPRYQDYQADSIQDVEEAGVKVRVIAGDYKGVMGPVVIQNPSMLMDVQIKQGGKFEQPVSTLSVSHTCISGSNGPQLRRLQFDESCDPACWYSSLYSIFWYRPPCIS